MIKVDSECARDTNTDIKKLLADFLKITSHAVQNAGYFVFSATTDDSWNLKFRCGSRASVMAFVHLFIVLPFCTTFYLLQRQNISVRFGRNFSANNTMGVTEIILIAATLSYSYYVHFIQWMQRKSLPAFLNKMHETLSTLTEGISDLPWVSKWFQDVTLSTKRNVFFVNLATFFPAIQLCCPDFIRIGSPLVAGRWSDLNLFMLIYPFFVIAWFSILTRKLNFLLLITSLIDGLQLGFRGVLEYMKKCGKLRPQLEIREVLRKFRELEELLKDFNDVMAPQLLAGLVSLLVIFIMAWFHLVVEVNSHPWNVRTNIFGLRVMIHGAVLLSMGKAASAMETQANACLTALRDISMEVENDLNLRQDVCYSRYTNL